MVMEQTDVSAEELANAFKTYLSTSMENTELQVEDLRKHFL
jgi:hypothetical protein